MSSVCSLVDAKPFQKRPCEDSRSHVGGFASHEANTAMSLMTRVPDGQARLQGTRSGGFSHGDFPRKTKQTLCSDLRATHAGTRH